ncbi:phosphatase PAP2 family protein [Clostridium sp. BL-8]|uniref:acid phosphatase n=1 Tax=Clostridium sp. BL-8 TaxID=349938 RepID=UPI00098CEC61|nr:phosphatase PAP2 family protein [Clostridium sp. BL-8]OOM79144.1 autolysin [Clostridium sp. BL-8]
MNFNKKIIPLVLATTVTQSLMPMASFADDNLTPNPSTYGYYVDNYKNNIKANMTPESNPSIGVLSQFLKIYDPSNGNVLDDDVQQHNINMDIELTSGNTTAAAVSTTGPLAQVFFDDRRNQNYSVIDGLGNYTDVFKRLSNAQTSVTTVGEAALTNVVKNDDDAGCTWADDNSQLGNMVKLVEALRATCASTSQAKNYYNYNRPYKWSSDVKFLPTLLPEQSTDGGFPSGHTNAAYISAIGLAYAFPERFQEMLTRASELGNNRIIAGMHSPLDVIGGRMTGTALSAAALNDPANAAIKAAAYNDGQTKLLPQQGTATDRFDDYKQNKKDYIDRLTYGFTQIGDTTKPMVVPKGAEVLLETRLPYLDANQRRDVLYTTGLESGYPLLDDAEGWGRLNLFAAADGYGAFNSAVTVNMDASKGGFNASDNWRNDISGSGSLTKAGTGSLKLGGDNTYSGGTEIQGGTLEADSATALGAGSVSNEGGTLAEEVDGAVNIKSDYKQEQNSTLELSIGSKDDIFEIGGNATFNGKLKLDFNNNYIPANGTAIITFNSNSTNSRFSSIETTGLPDNYSVTVTYDNNDVKLLIGTTGSSSGSHHHSSSSSSDSASTSTTTSSDTTTSDKGTNTGAPDKTANAAESGWQEKNGAWYNLSKEGTTNTGWFKDGDGKWYYLDKSGAMQTGWVNGTDGNWYYLDKSGAMQTGWVNSTDGNWYYLNGSGVMATGWFKDTDGNWYYLNESGAMEHDKYIDGYYVGSNGAWVN